MSFYDDDEKMYIPLSIDNADTNRSSYFFSNRKVVEMVLFLIPYFFLLIPLMQGGAKLLAIGIVTICYGIIYIYLIRFRIFEEHRLRTMVNELDKNRVSGVEHFWGINKITKEGVIHYVLDSRVGKELGLVVTFDRGSTVGVPQGNFNRFREAKTEFLRELHLQGFDFAWYELPKRKKTSEALVHYFNVMTTHGNEDFRKLLKLQIDINNRFVTEAEQPYVDYIVIRNHNFRTLRRFRQIVHDAMDNSFGMNSYIINPRILNKAGIEEFLEDYFVQDTIDSNKIRRGVTVKPFEEFGKVTRLVRTDGTEMPIEFIERFDMETEKSEYMALENILERSQRKVETQLKTLQIKEEKEIKLLKQKRLKDVISHKEYEKGLKEIAQKYEQEREKVQNPELEKEKSAIQPKKKKIAEIKEEQVTPRVVSVEEPIHLNVKQQMAARLEALKKQEEVKKQLPQTISEEELTLEERLARQAVKGDEGNDKS